VLRARHGQGDFAKVKVFPDAGKPVGGQKVPHHLRHLSQVPVLANLLAEGDSVDAWLVRIQFPRVKVHHERRGIMLVPVGNGLADQRVRELTKVIATGDRNVKTEKSDRGKRNLQELPSGRRGAVGKLAPRLRGVGPEQKSETRIVGVSCFRQASEYPQIRRAEPLLREPVAQHPASRRPFERFPRPHRVFQKRFPPGSAKIAMMVPLAGHLVTPGDHLPDQLRCGIGNPAKHEKRGASATFIQ
jgi:hypothetical protein